MEKVKRQLLQACINYGSIKLEDFQLILNDLCKAYQVEELSENIEGRKLLIDEINEKINRYDQMLSIIKHPLNNEDYVVFTLLKTNSACKFQPLYTDNERKYFYKLLETLANSEDFGLEWNNIYSVAHTLSANAQHPITKQRVQELEEQWICQGYFIAKDDKIFFGPRTIVEYGNYLKNHFPDFIKDCILCNKIVFWDIKCDECGKKLHRECIRKYLTKKSNCPACKKRWNKRLL